MNRAIGNMNRETLDTVHRHSLKVLGRTGVRFYNDEALNVFKKHGFRVQGETIYFSEKEISKALETVPSVFSVEARNPSKSIVVGDSHYVVAPGYGPPFIIEPSGEKRDARLSDVHRFCKLVQTSNVLDFNTSMVVHPIDVSSQTAHLDLLLATLTLTDKPIMGSSTSREAALDSLRLAQMVWGGTDRPVMISLINSLSPLQYAPEMVDALMVFARAGQPIVIHSACLLGVSGPITLAGSLVVSNAATLAGVCLAQLINPGTPIVYGLAGSAFNMATGSFRNAFPEDVKHTAIAAAMGRYYKIPNRGQGALTDSFCLDYQAGMEAAMMLTTGALSGVNLGIHGCGTYGSMLAMSYEKFIADEDLCGSIKHLIEPVELTEDAFAIDLIDQIGIPGNYLTTDHTFNRCRSEHYTSDFRLSMTHDRWARIGTENMIHRVTQMVENRLAFYVKPDMDPAIEKDLSRFVESRKNGRSDRMGA